MGSRGAGTLPCRAGGGWVPRGRHAALVDGVWGERSLPDGVRAGSMPVARQWPGDATGVRSGPLAKMALYYSAHLAVSAIAKRQEKRGEESGSIVVRKSAGSDHTLQKDSGIGQVGKAGRYRRCGHRCVDVDRRPSRRPGKLRFGRRAQSQISRTLAETAAGNSGNRSKVISCAQRMTRMRTSAALGG